MTCLSFCGVKSPRTHPFNLLIVITCAFFTASSCRVGDLYKKDPPKNPTQQTISGGLMKVIPYKP